jgi:hypothetical protein
MKMRNGQDKRIVEDCEGHERTCLLTISVAAFNIQATAYSMNLPFENEPVLKQN